MRYGHKCRLFNAPSIDFEQAEDETANIPKAPIFSQTSLWNFSGFSFFIQLQPCIRICSAGKVMKKTGREKYAPSPQRCQSFNRQIINNDQSKSSLTILLANTREGLLLTLSSVNTNWPRLLNGRTLLRGRVHWEIHPRGPRGFPRLGFWFRGPIQPNPIHLQHQGTTSVSLFDTALHSDKRPRSKPQNIVVRF